MSARIFRMKHALTDREVNVLSQYIPKDKVKKFAKKNPELISEVLYLHPKGANVKPQNFWLLAPILYKKFKSKAKQWIPPPPSLFKEEPKDWLTTLVEDPLAAFGELHAPYSISGTYNFMGSGTDVIGRLRDDNIGRATPLNQLDMISLFHDIKYMSSSNQIRREADQEMIDAINKMLKNEKRDTNLGASYTAKTLITLLEALRTGIEKAKSLPYSTSEEELMVLEQTREEVEKGRVLWMKYLESGGDGNIRNAVELQLNIITNPEQIVPLSSERDYFLSESRIIKPTETLEDDLDELEEDVEKFEEKLIERPSLGILPIQPPRGEDYPDDPIEDDEDDIKHPDEKPDERPSLGILPIQPPRGEDYPDDPIEGDKLYVQPTYSQPTTAQPTVQQTIPIDDPISKSLAETNFPKLFRLV